MQEGICIFCQGKEFVISQTVPSMKYVVLKCVGCGSTYEYRRSDISCSPEFELEVIAQAEDDEKGDD